MYPRTLCIYIVEALKRELQTFFGEHGKLFDENTTLRVFCDGGQKGVPHILEGGPKVALARSSESRG